MYSIEDQSFCFNEQLLNSVDVFIHYLPPRSSNWKQPRTDNEQWKLKTRKFS